MPDNLLNLFEQKPARSQTSIDVLEDSILHYRADLPGELRASKGFTHHLLTIFLTANERQTTHIDHHGEYDGRMEKGEFYLYPARASGFTRWQVEDETLHLIINPDLLRKVAIETECLNSDRLELLPVLKNYDSQLARLTQLFVTEMTNGSFGGQLYLESLSNILTIHLLRNYCVFKPIFRQYADGLASYKLRRIIDYIEAYLDTDLSLEAMAKQAGMSRYYFASQFKQAMGISPYQYVVRQRLKRARKLLEEKQRSLLQIALDCGFASQSHFNKVFRQHVGTTPKKYREKL